jgi:hypothetical protein
MESQAAVTLVTNPQQPDQSTPEQTRQTPFKLSFSPTIFKVAAALARAQGKYKPLMKNCEGKVSYAAKDGRPAGCYTFKYADLGAVIEATSEALSAEELAHTALIGGGIIRVMLLHSSGEWMASEAPLVSTGGPQQFGSQVTYYRRYLLSPLLGVASEDDDDANGAEGNGFGKTEKPKGEQGNQANQQKPAAQQKVEEKKPDPLKMLIAKLAQAGKVDATDVLGWMTKQLKREVKATKDLKAADIEQLTKTVDAILKEVK